MSSAPGGGTVLLVDGDNLLMRAIRGTERVALTSSDGVPTAGLMAFVNGLSKAVRTHVPERVVVCWDQGVCDRRVALYPGYKAQRPGVRPERDGEQSPFGLAREFLDLSGIPQSSCDGYEADDLIAYYHRRTPDRTRVVVLSGDKDLLQLLRPGDAQIRPGDQTPWTVERVEEAMGCPPRCLPLVLALTGDASDGIEGVRGIGPVTAARLLASNDWDLERLLESRPDRIPDPDLVRRNLALVDLGVVPDPSPPPEDPGAFRPTVAVDPGYDALVNFLRRFGLESIYARLRTNTLWEVRGLHG